MCKLESWKLAKLIRSMRLVATCKQPEWHYSWCNSWALTSSMIPIQKPITRGGALKYQRATFKFEALRQHPRRVLPVGYRELSS